MTRPAFNDFITTHFRYSELFERRVFDAWVRRPEWKRTDHLCYRLCADHLEPIRQIDGRPMLVTSGARDGVIHRRLDAQGLNPSPTSDHSFGDEWNPLGVGAVDGVPMEDGKAVSYQERDYHHIVGVRTETPEDPPWGQLIWYRHRGHIHVANHRDVLYSPRALNGLPFRKYRARTYVKE